jgi:hypothetical protein
VFVEQHGQQALSNTVWALTMFDTEDIEGAEETTAACSTLFCLIPPHNVHPQVQTIGSDFHLCMKMACVEAGTWR